MFLPQAANSGESWMERKLTLWMGKAAPDSVSGQAEKIRTDQEARPRGTLGPGKETPSVKGLGW